MAGQYTFEMDQAAKQGCCSGRRTLYVVVGVLCVLAVLALIIGLSVGLGSLNSSGSNDDNIPNDTPDAFRIDCFPEGPGRQEISKESCSSRGCFYQSPFDKDSNAPLCFMKTSTGYTQEGDSVIAGNSETFTLKSQGTGLFGPTIETAKFTVEKRTNDILRLKFTDAAITRYEVPFPLDIPEGADVADPNYEFKVTQESPFSFQVTRKATRTVIFDTGAGGLVLSEQFLQIATRLPTKNIYGLGENTHTSFRHDFNFRRWPAFSRDQPPGGEANLYSVHPFYECLEADGNAHGVLLYTSNAMDYELTPGPMVIFRTIGGVLDFYIFMGSTPENVIQQYTGAIGLPYMPPYWALGFQLSRYGFTNTSDMKAAVDRTLDNDIPLDVVHSDIDYMDHQRDFTIDPVNYPDLPQYLAELKESGVRNIIILDPCIEVNDTYPPYTRGQELDIFIKWESRDVMPPEDFDETNSTAMLGYVWPEWKVVFPDFLLSEAEGYWQEQVVDFHRVLDFDGLWLDMNEPANFGTNDEAPWNWPDDRPFKWSLICPNNTWDDPPYGTKAVYVHDEQSREARLSDKTLCMQAVQKNGAYRHYDVHSLYGHSQVEASLLPMRTALGGNKRGVIVTRSSFPGTGHFGGRWLGDNRSAWSHLKESIIGLLEFNLFGIPYVGADICGYFENTTPELCKRWMQLGAFYPFARNHNGLGNIHQDPGALGDEVVVASREALEQRYRLLPYLYTLFHEVNIGGGTVVRALMHEFPTDKQTWAIDQQFLWGPSLMISPILEQGQQVLQIYYPPGRWYDFYTGEISADGDGDSVEKDVTATSPIALHIRGGFIIPTQTPANNTQHSRLNPFGLHVALDRDDSRAHGSLFWDDGESIDTYENQNYYKSKFECNENILTHMISHNEEGSIDSLVMDNIRILGLLELSELGLPMDADFSVTWTA